MAPQRRNSFSGPSGMHRSSYEKEGSGLTIQREQHEECNSLVDAETTTKFHFLSTYMCQVLCSVFLQVIAAFQFPTILGFARCAGSCRCSLAVMEVPQTVIREQGGYWGTHILAYPQWWVLDVTGDGMGPRGAGASRPQGSVSGAALVGTSAQSLWKECEQNLNPETCSLCVLVGTGPGAFKSTDPAMQVIITPSLHMRKKRFREVK